MDHRFCPMCGGLLTSQLNRCRSCAVKIDSDYYPYLDEMESTPDTWDDWGIPDGPDKDDKSESVWHLI